MSVTEAAGETFLYFAYGSNMLTARLKSRGVPSAKFVTVANLEGHELRWHKKSKDLSGKCNVVSSTEVGASVLGVVFEILASEKSALDLAEGLNKGYVERRFELTTAQGPLVASAYVATEIDPNVVPYQWYKAHVVVGAKEHGLPAKYVEWLEATVAVRDPDRDRVEEEAMFHPNVDWAAFW